MSAYVVPKPHIDVVVTAAVTCKLIEFVEANETGRMLWDENHRSVNEPPDTTAHAGLSMRNRVVRILHPNASRG